MVRAKNSFIMYNDWIHTFKGLSNEEAGLLIKHILAYVNGEDKEADNRLVNLLFEPIKQTLRRDLEKWKLFIERQEENGALGGRPPKPKKPNPFPDNPHEPNEPKKPDSASDSVSVKIPTEGEWVAYGLNTLKERGADVAGYDFALKDKYEAFLQNGWRDGNNRPIKNWKSKLKAVLPFLKPIHAAPKTSKPPMGLM